MSEQTTNFATGAVRSADANHLDFTSLPLVGLIAVAKTASEGATKYSRYNYMRGMPVHDLLNHSFRHIVMFTLGDRSEPHLEHAAWGLLAAIQSQALDPEVSEPHMLGPGARLTAANLDYLAEQAPKLKAKREAGEFAGLGDWKLSDLPEIKRLLEQRRDTEQAKAVADPGPKQPCVHPCYGPCLRIEGSAGQPNPGPGETWVEYEGGMRAYYSQAQRAARTESHVPASKPVETSEEAYRKSLQQTIQKHIDDSDRRALSIRKQWSEIVPSR